MSTDVLTYIINKILETDADIDVRPGSAIHDLLISPLFSILNPFVRTQESLIDLLTLKDPNSMSEIEMDHLASNFFITRLDGSKVTGNIRLYYDRPVNVDIPIGTRFSTADGKGFYTKQSYSVHKVDMASNLEGSQYYAGDILVEAENSGTEYEVPANSITITDQVSVVPSRIRNPRAFTGGSIKESNVDLAQRIRDTFINNAMMSPYGIEKTLRSLYNNIRDIEVIGAGSPYMTRDVYAVPGTNISNFLGKITGLSQYPNVESVAYEKTYNVFEAGDVTSGVNLPLPVDFVKEFDDYKDIWRNDNYSFETIDEELIITETFNGQAFLLSGMGTPTYNNLDWKLSDPNVGGVGAYNPFSFRIEPSTNSIVLGYGGDTIDGNASYSQEYIDELVRLLENFRDGAYDDIEETYINAMIRAALHGISPEVTHNYSPVFHRYIQPNAGIVITGKFKTTSTSSDNLLSYITVHRNNASLAPHDGFGVAWKPGDGTYYNVYFVDNNVLQDDIYVGPNMIIEDYGVNNFISAHKLTINSDTWYNFRLHVTDRYGLKFWISTGAIDPVSSPDAEFGPTFGYRPVAAEQGTDFGVSVGQTKNKEWSYGELGIKIYSGVDYPIHMFNMKLDPEYYSSGDVVTVNYYGVGHGLDSYDGATVDNSLQLYIFNNNTLSWEYLAGNDSGGSDNKLAVITSGVAPSFVHNGDYVSSDFVKLAATTDTRNQLYHKLETYYIETVKGAGSHSGNYVDIYVDSPDRIQETSVNKTVTNGVLTFEGAGPVQEITSVSVVDGATLDDDEWTVEYVNIGEAFGQDATIRVIPTRFNADFTNMTITYRYLSDGSSMQNTVESSSFRSPSQNNLIKVMPAYTVSIDNFPYYGNVVSSEMKQIFKNYINGLTNKTLKTSELISLALDNGATSVDTSDIVITLRYQDLNGRQYTKEFNNSYTIEGIGNFFTAISDLSGVTQQ